MTLKSFFFEKDTLESLTKDVLKSIILKYTSVIGYYLVDRDIFVPSNKETVEAFVSRKEIEVEKELAEWIIYAQDHLVNKYEEMKQLKNNEEKNRKLDSQVNYLNQKLTTNEMEADEYKKEIEQLKKDVSNKEEKIVQQEKNLAEKDSTIEALRDELVVFKDTANYKEQDDHNVQVHRTKIELIPPYHGLYKENFENWFFIIDKFQKNNKIEDKDMLNVIAPLFRSNALFMLRRFENINGEGKYKEFMETIKNLTGGKAKKYSIIRKLDQLVQTKDFESYIEEFMDLIQHVDDIDESELISIFISGLKPDARKQLILMETKNFDEVVLTVARFESNRIRTRRCGPGQLEKSNYRTKPFPKGERMLPSRDKKSFHAEMT